MNQEILSEFLIKKYGDNYAILATDKAYELLGIKDKQIISPNGWTLDAISDSQYRTAFTTFLSNNYRVDGLLRTSRGNSHDANWKTEVRIINNGGLWSDELNSYREEQSSTYADKPDVIDEEKLTNEIIENWAEDYDLTGDGEDERMVYCSYHDNSGRFCFSFEKCFLIGTAISKEHGKGKSGYEGSRIYLRRQKG